MTTLSTIGEFGLIDRLQQIVDRTPVEPMLRPDQGGVGPRSGTSVGIGDDAAVWRPTPGHELVLTCDAFVEGRHFLPLADATGAEIQRVGARVATANLSDIAAMAALPRFALVSLGIPKAAAIAQLEALYRGLCGTLHGAGAHIIGGNITSTEGPLFVDITAAGQVESGKATLRTGAQPGDWLGVTGYPGSAGAGLKALLGGNEGRFSAAQLGAWKPLTEAYLAPTARLREARLLAPHVHAMTDISDGLAQDLPHLLKGSACGACIEQNKLPISPAMADFCHHTKQPHHGPLWQPSDDYELLFCAPADAVKAVDASLAQATGTPLHWIGQIVEEDGIYVQEPNGEKQPLAGTGWDHFG